MKKKIKEVKVDNHAFNADHFADWSEADFIKHEFDSVPDSYGSKENKVAFLKNAHAAIMKANGKEAPEKKSTKSEK